MVLLEAWKEAEAAYGDAESLQAVVDKMPKVVKKRRKVGGEDGGDATTTWEEYFDYIFPDDEVDKPNFKLLAMAHQWKIKMAEMANKKEEDGGDEDQESDSSDEDESEEEKGDEQAAVDDKESNSD